MVDCVTLFGLYYPFYSKGLTELTLTNLTLQVFTLNQLNLVMKMFAKNTLFQKSIHVL